MSHNDIEELLLDLLAGTLPTTLIRAVEEHLECCSPCRQVYSEYLVIWLTDGRAAVLLHYHRPQPGR